jgi:hypothetical protein
MRSPAPEGPADAEDISEGRSGSLPEEAGGCQEVLLKRTNVLMSHGVKEKGPT